MPRLIVCRNCTESDCTYCNMNILAVALERGYFNSLMGEQHTVQIDSELVPVRHGHWTNISISVTGNSSAECSRCGAVVHDCFSNTINYCPNCGTKMDKTEERLLMPKADGSTIKMDGKRKEDD